MTKRYYLADIIGDGTDENPFRPALQDHGVSWTASIPTNMDENSPNYGKPLHSSCFAIVEADTPGHNKLRADSRIESLPDEALGRQMSSIAETTKTALLLSLSKKGFAVGIKVDSTYKATLSDIGIQRDPDFNIDTFGIS